MSYTQIFAFGPDGNAYKQGEIHNSHRGAMSVWRHLEEKHLPEQRPAWATAKLIPGYASRFPTGDPQQVWDLVDDARLTLSERIVLGSTFDRVIVRREDLPRLIAAYRAFEAETTLPEQADIILKAMDETDLIAIGWNQTSVICDTWDSDGGYDEATDEYIPYNLLTGTDHIDLFKDIIDSYNSHADPHQ